MSDRTPEIVLTVAAPDLYELGPWLAEEGFALIWAESVDVALTRLQENSAAIVAVPVDLAKRHGLAERLADRFPSVELVLVTEPDQSSMAAGMIEGDDVDYLLASADPMLVASRLRRAVRHRDRRLELQQLRRKIAVDQGFGSMLGTSPRMQAVFELIGRAAGANASVLVTGESGTGKELVARALHQGGRRREQPFVAINCSAVPESLLESELFGHVKGAFTDARDSRVGLFAKAHGGTLFLDEIGDLPLALQPKLLRALQERTVRPVGGDREVAIDVRVVAATNHDLEDAVRERRFREDLFYRLNVIHIDVPPLRERAGDILLLAERLVRAAAQEIGKEIAGLSRQAATALLRYGWPGNVRELQNYMERAAALCEDDIVRVPDLPQKLRTTQALRSDSLPMEETELVRLDVIEQRYIQYVLDAMGGNKKAAARVLGLDRKTLYRKLERYRIDADTRSTPPDADQSDPVD